MRLTGILENNSDTHIHVIVKCEHAVNRHTEK